MFNWASLTNPSLPGDNPPGVPPRTATATKSHRINARYDNATTTDENRRNWWGADYLSAKSANNFGVRRTLRNRSRYEVSNNPYLYGICTNNADDLIGRGPTLQVKTGNAQYDRAVERSFAAWAAEVSLVSRLRTTKLAKTVDGEGFLVLKSVDALEHPVKLWPVDVEADQVTTPAPTNLSDFWADGLVLQPVTGEPLAYHVLKHHPGDYFFPDNNPLAVEVLQARHVVHWFAKFRPGQVRGVPVFTSALDLFAELRAYRRAVLGAAELAADFAAVIEQDREVGAMDPDADTDTELEAFKRVPVERKMMTSLPPGAKMNQFDAKQPTTSYESFQEKCLGEACRPLSYPLNLALGTSQKFNFSSAKLDHINYRATLDVERSQCNKVVLGPLFRAWYEEAVLCGAVPMYDGTRLPPHEWHWPGYAPIDPVADAQAIHTRLSNGTLSRQRYHASEGEDWQEVFAQLAKEDRAQKKLGLEFGEPATKSITEDGDAPGGDDAPTPRATAKGRKRLVAFARKVLRLFDEGKVKRDDDGRFGEGGSGSGGKSDKGSGNSKSGHSTGSSSDSPDSLKDRARTIAKAVARLGPRAVAVARGLVDKAKNVVTAVVTAGVHADDVLDTAHDWSKITNDKAMNASIAEHIGIPLNAAVQGAIVKVLAFGICKVKGYLAKRREAQRTEAAGSDAPAPLTPTKKAELVAHVLRTFLRAMGAERDQLPTAGSVAGWLRKRDRGTRKKEAARAG